MNSDQQSLMKALVSRIYDDDCEIKESFEVVLYVLVSLARALHVPQDKLLMAVTTAYTASRSEPST